MRKKKDWLLAVFFTVKLLVLRVTKERLSDYNSLKFPQRTQKEVILYLFN